MSRVVGRNERCMVRAGASGGLTAAVHETLMRNPLTARERQRGGALRIGGCVRADETGLNARPSGLVWSILAIGRDEVETLSLNWVSRAMTSVLGGHSKVSVCSSTVLDIDGERWVASEFEMPIPRRQLAFALHSRKARYLVSRRLRNEHVVGHFEQIRNAYAAVEDYGPWLECHRTVMEQELLPPSAGPLISLVTPVYRTPPEFLETMISSVEAQTYGTWELVLVNASPEDAGVASVLASHPDARIVVVDHPKNDGIAGNTNVGIAASHGDYVAFLDHDDFLEPHALAAIVRAVADDPSVDLLYCDEDTFDGECFKIPLFKPPLNWDFLYSNNYVIHLLTVSRRALEATERSGPEVDGAQDYDLTLKAVRLPYVLYHWRQHAASTNANADAKPWAQEAGRRAIVDHLERRGIPALVYRAETDSTYRVDFALPKSAPSLTCVALGERVPCGLVEAVTGYGETHGVSTKVCCVTSDGAALARFLKDAAGDVALIVRDDVTLSQGDLETMLGYFNRPEVFSVVPRAMRQDGLAECSGCLAAPDGSIIKLGKGLPWADEAFLGRAVRPYDHLVVSDDACMVRLPLPKGWADAAAAYEHPLYALNELVVRAYEAGLLNAYCPFAEAHIEGPRSLLVGWVEPMAEDAGQFLQEHSDLLAKGDPTHNQNFDPWSAYYKLGCVDGERKG